MKRLTSIVVILCLASTGWAAFSLTNPNAVGGNITAMVQDKSSYPAGSSAFLKDEMAIGPGLEFFLKYDVTPSLFMSVGTGLNTINHPVKNVTSARTTLLPTAELKFAYVLSQSKQFSPYVMAGLHAFGHQTTVKSSSFTSSEDRYYDAAFLIGAGAELAVNERTSIHASGDYRFVFSSDDDPQPRYWVAKGGIVYNLTDKTSGNQPFRDEIEYPVGGDDDIASLDDLFKDSGSGSDTDDLFGNSNEDDALSLLFEPEEESGADTDFFSDNTSSPYADDDLNSLMRRIDELKGDMNKGMSQLRKLESQVNNNEKVIAELTGEVAGEYAGIAPGSQEQLSNSVFNTKYDAALQSYNSKQYQNAIQQFQQLLASNPGHRLASNCQYWIGECYNGLGKYRDAISAFTNVMQYRSSYKFDDALIMNGICYMKLGESSTAKQNFEELLNRYPDSEYAPKAMRYLGRL